LEEEEEEEEKEGEGDWIGWMDGDELKFEILGSSKEC
jgi:hypothetical protein